MSSQKLTLKKKNRFLLIQVPKVAAASALECFEILFSKELTKNEAKMSAREVTWMFS